MHLSIILPAKNEAEGLRRTLPGLRAKVSFLRASSFLPCRACARCIPTPR